MYTAVVDLPGLDALEASADRSLAPGLTGLVAALQRVSPEPHWDFARIREGFEAAAALPVPEDVSVTGIDVAGMPGELIEPAITAGRIALYLHDGAYTMAPTRSAPCPRSGPWPPTSLARPSPARS
jgi:hypothetical protein